MGRVSITFEAEHSETGRVPLDAAVAGFVDALKTRGYTGVASVEWTGELARHPINRDGSGGAVLAREPFGGTRRFDGGAGTDEPLGRDGTDEPEPSSRAYEPKGGGYYDLLEDGELVKTVRGRARAEKWVG